MKRFLLAFLVLLTIAQTNLFGQATNGTGVWNEIGGTFNWAPPSGGGGDKKYWDGPSSTVTGNGEYPSGLAAIATMTNNITSNQTVELETSANAALNVSLRTLNIGDLTNPGSGFSDFTISAPTSGVLTIGTASGAGAINSSNGTNTISAGITLGNAATFQHTTATGSLVIQGNVNNGSNLLTIGGSGTTTISGIIGSGSGGLTENDGGTLILENTNTYSGTTTISGGTLRIGSGGTVGTLGSGAVTNNSILEFSRSNSMTVANAISGTGNVSQSGGGTTILTGTNSYGTTTISAGTLQIGSGGTAGTLGSGAVTNNSILAFNRSDSVTVATAISGTGNVTQSGGGTTILTGTNSYGTTTISAGTLQIGNGGTTGTLGSGTVTNDAALVFNRSNSLSVGNTISGTGSVTQSGGGATTLTSLNTYTGATNVSAGSLIVSSTGAINSPASALTVSGGTAQFDSSGTGSFSTASIAATLTVNGTVTTSGLTATGLLQGNGTINGSVAMNSGSTLAAGTSVAIGTLSTDSLSLNAGSNFAYDLSTSSLAADKVNVSGSLSFAGSPTLSISYIGADVVVAPGTKFTLFGYTSGGWNGSTFFGLADNSIFTNGANIWRIDYDDPSFGVNGGLGTAFLTITAVPESSAFMYGSLVAMAGIYGIRRRKKLAGKQDVGATSL